MAHPIMLQIIALIGLSLSVYLLFVERKLEEDKNYKAACDINKKITCTGVASTKYAYLLGFSNAYIGIVFYFFVLFLAYLHDLKMIFYLSVISVLFAVYLAYISYFKLKKICIVCHATYLVNIVILFASFLGM